MFYFTRRLPKLFPILGMLTAVLYFGVLSPAIAENSPSDSTVHKTSMQHQDSTGWAEKLKGTDDCGKLR